MANHRKIWIGLGGIGVLVVLILLALAARDQAPTVSIVQVTREDVNASITSNGKVEPISPYVAHAEFATFVSRVAATEGQAVKRGQLILELNAADMRAQLAQARSDLLAAQADLRNAKSGGPPDEVAQLQGDLQKAQVQVANLERTQAALKELVAKQAATTDELAQNQVQLTQARTNLQTLVQKKESLARRAALDEDRASLRVHQAQTQVEALEEKVRSATVISPVDGTLHSLPVHFGDYVKVGDTLAEMADLHHVRVRAFVDEPDLGWLAPDQSVEVTWDAKPNREWSGRTEQIPKQVVARNTRSVGEVLCSVNNDKLELLPNVNVEVRIQVRRSAGALVVPRAAVRYDHGKHFVFVYADDRLHRREITVGIASVTKYEALAGLHEGDRVALPGDLDVRDGMEVRAAEAR